MRPCWCQAKGGGGIAGGEAGRSGSRPSIEARPRQSNSLAGWTIGEKPETELAGDDEALRLL